MIHLRPHPGICTACGKTAAHLVKAPTVANTCAQSVREWYHTWSPGENISGLTKGLDTLYTAFGETISQNTHR